MSRSVTDIAVVTQGWADRINAAWRRSAESFIAAGQLLIECKATVPHRSFANMIETQLEFSSDRAQRLMTIARDRRLSDPANFRFLPTHWSTLHLLTKLSDAEFYPALQSGVINKHMRASDVPGRNTPPLGTVTAEAPAVKPPDLVLVPTSPRPEPEPQPEPEAPQPGMIPVWIDPTNPVQMFAVGFSMARTASKELAPAQAVREYPQHMPLLADDIAGFWDWLDKFERGFRERYGIGNEEGVRLAAQ